MGEERGPQVVDDALPGPRREVDLRVAERVLDGQGHRRTAPTIRDSPGQSPAEDVGVDGDLDQVRLDEVHRRQEREQGAERATAPRYGRV